MSADYLTAAMARIKITKSTNGELSKDDTPRKSDPSRDDDKPRKAVDKSPRLVRGESFRRAEQARRKAEENLLFMWICLNNILEDSDDVSTKLSYDKALAFVAYSCCSSSLVSISAIFQKGANDTIVLSVA